MPRKQYEREYCNLVTVFSSEGKSRNGGRIFQLIFIISVFYQKTLQEKEGEEGEEEKGRRMGIFLRAKEYVFVQYWKTGFCFIDYF